MSFHRAIEDQTSGISLVTMKNLLSEGFIQSGVFPVFMLVFDPINTETITGYYCARDPVFCLTYTYQPIATVCIHFRGSNANRLDSTKVCVFFMTCLCTP